MRSISWSPFVEGGSQLAPTHRPNVIPNEVRDLHFAFV
jgi:hypothetical protein